MILLPATTLTALIICSSKGKTSKEVIIFTEKGTRPALPVFISVGK